MIDREQAIEQVSHELRILLFDRDPENEVELPPTVGEAARTIVDVILALAPPQSEDERYAVRFRELLQRTEKAERDRERFRVAVNELRDQDPGVSTRRSPQPEDERITFVCDHCEPPNEWTEDQMGARELGAGTVCLSCPTCGSDKAVVSSSLPVPQEDVTDEMVARALKAWGNPSWTEMGQSERSPVLELSWPCGDRAYGRGRGFRTRAIYRRLRWHWKHRRQGCVRFPPGQWWSPGTIHERPDVTSRGRSEHAVDAILALPPQVTDDMVERAWRVLLSEGGTMSQEKTNMGQSEAWQDRVPEELITQLMDEDEMVQFTDAWRELSEFQQLDRARDWLRRALGLEQWR